LEHVTRAPLYPQNLLLVQIPLAELIKENKRTVSRAIRELDRERTRMEREEKKLIADIKKMAAEGQTKAVHIQAKELVRTRNFITKFLQMRAHLNAVLLKIQTVKSHEAMAKALKGTTAAMVKMNKQMNLPAMQKIMVEFQAEEMKAEMTMEVGASFGAVCFAALCDFSCFARPRHQNFELFPSSTPFVAHSFVLLSLFCCALLPAVQR